ncbi:MAG: pyridoxamine 5'-phosphate oxidase family protein [Rikenellaceae bacterium]
MELDSPFIDFISKHHVMTLATISKENVPSCCALFYVYIKEANVFVFTSSEGTKHVENMVINNKVAANIVLETKVVGQIEGLQIEGEVVKASESDVKNAKKEYLKKYPFAIFMDIDLWVLKPSALKLTDNKLGFGKKLLWSNLQEII